jgi:ABC-type glutathione transport system ATPase component
VSHLDRSLADRVLTMLKQETRRNARTVLCVLHDLSFVDRFADAVLTLGTGCHAGWLWTPTAV